MDRKLLIRLLVSMVVLNVSFTAVYAGVTAGYIESTGSIKTSSIQITNGAAAGRFLESDGSGNATWQNIPAGVSDHGQLTSTGTLTHAQIENNLISVGVATGTLRTDLTTETNNRTGADNAIGIATATLRTDVNAKVNRSGDTMTGTLNAPDVNATYGVSAATLTINTGIKFTASPAAGRVLTSDAGGNATWQNIPAGVSDHGQLTSTGTLTHAQLENNLVSVGIATGTLRTDLTTETNNRTGADNAIGIATGTLRTDLTSETNNRINADNAIGIATATLRTDVDAKVNRSGDTMTGNLNAPNMIATYGVSASTIQATTGIQLTNGAAAGKILTSDASGNATWQDNAAGTSLLSSTNTWTANQTFNNQNITANGNIQTADASAFYFGDPGTNGTWMVQRSGSDLVYSRRESGSYVEKYRVIP